LAIFHNCNFADLDLLGFFEEATTMVRETSSFTT